MFNSPLLSFQNHGLMAEMLALKVGERLRDLRDKRKISQTLLADHAQVDRSYISLIENGRYDVTVAMLKKLCVVLQVTVEEFFRDTDI